MLLAACYALLAPAHETFERTYLQFGQLGLQRFNIPSLLVQRRGELLYFSLELSHFLHAKKGCRIEIADCRSGYNIAALDAVVMLQFVRLLADSEDAGYVWNRYRMPNWRPGQTGCAGRLLSSPCAQS